MDKIAEEKIASKQRNSSVAAKRNNANSNQLGQA